MYVPRVNFTDVQKTAIGRKIKNNRKSMDGYEDAKNHMRKHL